MNTFISTLDLLTKLKTFLAALELSPGVKLFERTEIYENADLVKAIQDLKISRDRICIIIPSSNEYATNFAGEQVQSEAKRQFILLMADRVAGSSQGGLLGTATKPGVVKMSDMVEDALTGNNLGCMPVRIKMHALSGEPFSLAAEDRSNRSCWQMTWQCSAGRKVVVEK
jgi:hypothetical protein